MDPAWYELLAPLVPRSPIAPRAACSKSRNGNWASAVPQSRRSA